MSKKLDELIDEFEGQGGSFVINPKTSQRELVARTVESDESANVQAVEESDHGIAAA